MNSIKSLVFKFAFMMVALFSVNYASAAETINATLEIPDTKITSYDQTALVSVRLTDEQADVAALQFRFLLPPELEFADGIDTEPIPSDRLIENNHVIALNTETGMVVLQSLGLKEILGTSGEIMQIPVKVKEGQLESGKTVQIAVSMIEFSSGNGQNTGHQANFNAAVLLEPFTYKAYLEPAEMVAYPSVATKMTFSLENIYTGTTEAAPVLGFTINVNLPEGFTINPESITKNTDRVFNRTIVTYENGMFWFSDVSQNRPLKSGISDGPLFTFDVVAPADYVGGENDMITFSDFKVSAVLDAYAVQGENATWEDCPISDGAALNKVAYEEVLINIEAVEKKYEAAVAEIEETNPDFDLTEWKEIIGNAIEEAKTGAEQALNSANEDGVAYSFAFSAEDIEVLIEEMKAEAGNSSLIAGNQAAYEIVVEKIEAVETAYNDAIAEIEETNPDFDLTEWKELIGNAIDEAKTGAEQALNAANENGEEFVYAFTGEDIEDMINEMKAASDKDLLTTANEAAYKEVEEAINAVEAEYNAAIVEIEENYPTFDLTEWKEIIGNAIEEAKTGAEQAFNAANEDGEEFAFEFTGEDIRNMIAEMKAEAEHTNLVEGNQAAYEIVLDAIKEAEVAYHTAVAEIEENYPDYDLTEWKALIENALNEAITGAEQALKAANENGEEFTFAFDSEEIDAMIKEMKAAPAQAALEAANKVAYDKVYAQIVVLEGKYLTAIAEIQENHPDYDVTEWKEIIENAINEAKIGAQQALESANEDGVEFSFEFDGSEIEAMIEEMLKDMQTSAISAIEADVEAGNASIYTLDGRKQSSLVRGEVNIIMRGNTTTKMYIRK